MGIWGARVVAVDDDPDTLDLVHTILTDAGASVVALSEPGLAFTTILGFMPDVLLVDIAMPGEDGLTLMRKVRSLSPERGGRIPAATLTAAPPGEGQLALWTAAGFQRHILKPFLPPALIATVNE